MINVYIVHNNPDICDEICNSEIKIRCFFTFYDEGSKKDKSKAYKLKEHWAAKKTPFAIVYDGEQVKKVFYSEADNNIIDSLVKYLNSYENKI